MGRMVTKFKFKKLEKRKQWNKISSGRLSTWKRRNQNEMIFDSMASPYLQCCPLGQSRWWLALDSTVQNVVNQLKLIFGFNKGIENDLPRIRHLMKFRQKITLLYNHPPISNSIFFGECTFEFHPQGGIVALLFAHPQKVESLKMMKNWVSCEPPK